MAREAVEFLKQVELFSLLGDGEIESIIEFLRTIDVDEAGTLFRQGDEGHELYIVRSGKIRVAITLHDGREKDITEFLPGDFFGEMSIFENAPRSATCYASEPSILYALMDRDFYRLMEDSPSLAIKIMYRMSNITTRRLHSTGEFLSDMVVWGKRARKRAITDELTGVYNRHFLDDALENQIRRAREGGSPLSVVMVDLDHFRSINDAYGHEVGDEILLSAVEVFKRHLRERDILARYGGDEFTILLPQTGIEKAASLAKMVCDEMEQIETLQHRGGTLTRVTTSQGIAVFPTHANDLPALMKKADEALYRAKELGRNRVVYADDN
ncbi:MAG: GGDEF domain-containing protein [Spirochaetes bacterium]|nr:GGDEF domain-containing protein [Spirochaetota bacterium]